MGDLPCSIAQAQLESEQGEKGRGEGRGQSTTQPPGSLLERALSRAGRLQKSTAVSGARGPEESTLLSALQEFRCAGRET